MVKKLKIQFNKVKEVVNKHPRECIHINNNKLWCIIFSKIVRVKKAYRVEMHSSKLTLEPKENTVALHTCMFAR